MSVCEHKMHTEAATCLHKEHSQANGTGVTRAITNQSVDVSCRQPKPTKSLSRIITCMASQRYPAVEKLGIQSCFGIAFAQCVYCVVINTITRSVYIAMVWWIYIRNGFDIAVLLTLLCQNIHLCVICIAEIPFLKCFKLRFILIVSA